MRVLITNDDGVESPGLHALAAAALEQGWDVLVAAPAHESSGSSAAITSVQHDGRVVADERRLPGLAGAQCFAVQAAPAFIAFAASRGAFGAAPELVLSGINLGANVGRSVLHSGTLGAAITGAMQGARAMAVSLDAVSLDAETTRVTGEMWRAAAIGAGLALPPLLAAPRGTVFNVNLPPTEQPATMLHRATLARFGAVQGHVDALTDGRLRVTTTRMEAEGGDGSDASLLADGLATITEVTWIRETDTARLPTRVGPAVAERGTASAS
ncbi:5'-nucleotidase [Actinoalloteichus hoggarensis]|uniref:5'-nucleotidase n=1 Tax=Actinoalloteichus hoggarensis TaxID=1470176 RepID=A0A221W8N7_9PSEU|nr:5'/3'-nucleotidase SurE [Actinoalloteichus hoggarensis]ASO21889.1 5'-nucleotidase SurE [Actinoalloteichus hoggarensis]MBB5922486.1 5'-nucleotidase [Actinoalloteichus hoggarensis]